MSQRRFRRLVKHIAGDAMIVPTRIRSASSATRVEAKFRLCVDEAGQVESALPLRVTGFPAYDRDLLTGMQRWVYSPYEAHGEPATSTSFTRSAENSPVRGGVTVVTAMLRVATLVESTEAEGPGHRFALWVQGCSIRCAGCCNPEMFDPRRGEAWSIARILERVPHDVEGITLLGGEPFDQATAAAELARAARARGLTVMVFSGYTLAELRGRAGAQDLLASIDLLVDGRYERDQPEPPPPQGRRWIGSSNQTMHFLSDAYAPDDPRMREPNTIEIRIGRGTLAINGWPSADKLLR
jgi:anaerobic ribonucleoside-triphosphate reductase activating protein